jgi:tetrahydromethanopterin S-methyltransferase subunit G
LPNRNLSDDDISELVKQLKAEFFSNVGKGVWSLAWKGFVIGLIILSLYGAHK